VQPAEEHCCWCGPPFLKGSTELHVLLLYSCFLLCAVLSRFLLTDLPSSVVSCNVTIPSPGYVWLFLGSRRSTSAQEPACDLQA
jgi:hypothetical protein